VGLFQRSDREAFGAAAAAFALLAMVLAGGALVAVANVEEGGGGDGATAAAGGSSVKLADLSITPADITADVGGSLSVDNDGALAHNLVVEGHDDVKTPDLDPGDSATLDLAELPEGSYTVFCSIPGHRDGGMEANLTVGAGGTSANAGGSTGHADHEQLLAENDEADRIMKEPVDAFVAQLEDGANTKGVGNQPLEPRVLADGTKVFRLTAEVTDWEVEPGRVVEAWAYNGQVPGPLIKVAVDDRVRIVLDNKLPQSTSVHFHGLELPVAQDGVPDVTQEPIKPGDTYTYEFTAQGPMVAMYHSHHHAEHQVPDGLLGAFLVGDQPLPPGVGPITQEIPMILNDAGAIGLSLNGKSFPATAPIMAKAGEWVQIHYMNEGLQVHPMHLHGIPQLVIAKDGFPLPQPYTVDTLNVAPGERYTVVVNPQPEHAGVWAYHCHILNHAERDTGMFGMVTTFIVS
jgi:uncharacterized cupredoxin-like copper-binding protein